MILNHSETGGYSELSSNKNSDTGFVAFELKRLLCLACTVALLMALLSYSPTDPSWSTWSTDGRLHNWMGRFGSILADTLYQLFGLTALALAALPTVIATKMPFRDNGNWGTRSIGPFLMVSSLGILFQTSFPHHWMPWQLSHPGGLLGELLAQVLGFAVGSMGVRLVAVVAFLCSLILVFRWQLITRTENWFRKSAPRSIPVILPILKQQINHTKKLPSVWSALRAKFTKVKQQPVEPGSPVPSELPSLDAGANDEQTTEEMTDEDANDGESEENSEEGEDVQVPEALIGATIAEPVKRAPQQKIPKNRVHKGRRQTFQLPHLQLLSGKAESKNKPVEKSWYLEKGNILVQKLKDFGVDGEVVHISPGPVITVYEFKPASGVKIKEISNLSDDLTLALSVLSVRIVAPIPGKPVVGIEIPSPHREMVFFKDLIQETPFFKSEIKIPIVLGRLASGEPVAADLASMPHLLIAGSTGTGKSVFMNTLISSLLYRFSPEQLKLILVDPKMVELSQYEGIPHLLLPVVVDSKKAVMALRWTVDEMERRYTAMHQFGVRHIDAFNEKLCEYHKEGKELDYAPLPYIVVVIDEYADLMAVVPKEVELSIARLAQKARASGIHLVLATQRPSTDVVTGTIKANFPTRLSFRVASSIDSKTILDRTGAERLLGHGDMLFHSAGFTTLKRMQGPFLSDADTNRVVEYLKAQGEPEYDEKILAQAEEIDLDGSPSADSDDEEGRLYDQAVRIVTEKGEASISLIQRHLRIGYNRAATLMEQMEKEGVVGASTGPAKRRSVLVNS